MILCRIGLFALLCWSCLLAPLYAQGDLTARLEKAAQSYQNQQYMEAMATYEVLIEDGYQSADLYYNLGNCYFQLNRLGPAILNFEKGLKLQPSHKDLQHNLVIAQNRQVDELEKLPPFFLQQWWQNTRDIFSSTTWGILNILLLWCCIAAVIIWQIATQRNYRKWGMISAGIALLLTAFTFVLGNNRLQYEQQSGMAIVTKTEANLQNAPDDRSNSIMTIHEGLKVQLLDKIGDWYKVQLPNGEQGWLIKEVLEEV